MYAAAIWETSWLRTILDRVVFSRTEYGFLPSNPTIKKKKQERRKNLKKVMINFVYESAIVISSTSEILM